MEVKTVLLDNLAVKRALKRISHEIIENNKGVSNVVLLGIARGGIPFCNLIKENIYQIENVNLPMGLIDITLYRDDLLTQNEEPKVNGNKIDFSVTDKDVILCDDVLYTGRTVRAGIDAIIKFGRPRTVQLAVLIDRGHRELPIRADYVGKNVPTSRDEIVLVRLDGQNNDAVICNK
jgi:pyrimidine operon attenuation protein/uracil phosphoribosyltransferase